MYRKFHANEEMLNEVAARLGELLTIKLERYQALPTDEDAGDIAYNEKKNIDRLSYLSERFRDSLRYGQSEQEENEQLAAIDKFIETELIKESRHGYGTGDRVKALRHYFEDLRSSKHEALKTFAKLADDLRVKLLAVNFLLESVPHSATHRTKDFKIGMVQETVTAIVEDLAKVDKNYPEHYHWHNHDLGSWDYAQALVDLHHKTGNVTRLEKEIEELRSKLAEYEPATNGTEKPEGDPIPF